MEDTTKYTKDGRKVAVIGKLNAEEYIVQEIFVSNGREFPGGENFTAKGLLDEPAEPWKAKHLRELEERYDRRKAEMEREFAAVSRRLEEQIKKARLRAEQIGLFAKNAEAGQLDTLHAFLGGEITHFVIESYGSPEIVTWEDDSLFMTDSMTFSHKRIEAMRLISLYGKSDGSLEYRLSHYSDGSGGSHELHAFRSYEDALAYVQQMADEQAAEYLAGDRQSFNVERWQKIEGIRISEAVIEKHRAEDQQKRQAQIEKLKAELAELESADD